MIKFRNNKSSILMSASAMAAVLLAGCQKEGGQVVSDDEIADGKVHFTVSVSSTGDIGSDVRSGVVSGHYVLVSEDASIELPVLGLSSAGRAHTRGTLINNRDNQDNPGDPIAYDKTKSFFVSAWNADNTERFIPAKDNSEAFSEVKYFETNLAESGSPEVKRNMWNTIDAVTGEIVEYTWFPDEVKTFFAYANPTGSEVPEITKDGDGYADGMTLAHTVPAAASAQTDFLLGYYSGTGSTGTPAKQTGMAAIRFYHPMTAVIFRLGTITGLGSINSISINGVFESGVATMNIEKIADDEATPDTYFTWAPTGEDFTTKTVSQDISSLPTAAGQPMIGEPFVLIPQTFSSDSQAYIAIAATTLSGKDINLYLRLAGENWKAGYTNTYIIGYDGGNISVQAKYSVSSGSITGLVAKNSGNADAYIRAAIVTNWVDESGKVLQTVVPAFPIPEGSSWSAKLSDGFYYYTKGVKAGKATEGKLFESYSAPDGKPEGADHLEFKVIVQGISFTDGLDNAKTCWGNEIPLTEELEEETTE